MSGRAPAAPPVFEGGGRVRALVVRRSAAARRLTLAVDPRDGRVRLTLPARGPLAPALAWVEGRRGWIEAALAALPPPGGLGPGAVLSVEGVERTIDWRADGPRTPRIDGDRLLVGGPAELVGARVLRWLRARALAVLTADTRAMAAAAGVDVGRIGVGDARTRWGSCTAAGDVRYSWRLILAPPDVRRATVAHELGHRRHMDHGPAFHAEVARILGRDPAPERAWLRAHGTRLQAIGRTD